MLCPWQLWLRDTPEQKFFPTVPHTHQCGACILRASFLCSLQWPSAIEAQQGRAGNRPMAWLKKTAPGSGGAPGPPFPGCQWAAGIRYSSHRQAHHRWFQAECWASTKFFTLSREPDSNPTPRHQVILPELSVDFGDWSPLEFDGFSDKRKLIAWARPNDQLAPIAGSS